LTREEMNNKTKSCGLFEIVIVVAV
jgi:hypothetical protein